LDEDTK